MVLCFAACCSHQTVRNQCSFFRFPKDQKLKKLWTDMSRRADKKPNDDSRLCSCHFQDGKKENHPTIFSYREKTKFDFASPEKRTRRKTTCKKTQLRRNAVSPCKLSRPVESHEYSVNASKKKAQKRKSHSDSESEEEGTTLKTNDGVKKRIHSNEMNKIILPVTHEKLNTEYIEVKPDILLVAGCDNFDFSETLQSSHSETEVMPEITDRVIGDIGASDEETSNPPRNESIEFLKQKLKQMSATNEKLEKRLAESRMLCQLYLKENANLKEVIDNLRQIMSVSNDN